jgi:hypothetical protein
MQGSNVSNNILAIRVTPDVVLPPNPFNNTVRSGLRSVLAVRKILAKVQTTVFFGNSLYMIWHDVGQLSSQQMFAFFVSEYLNKPLEWDQLSVQPPPVDNFNLYLQAAAPVPLPVSFGTVTPLTCGFDPLQGYWIEFAGNYFLGFPIFKDWAKEVIRDGPNFKGYQGELKCPWHQKK